MTRSPNRDNQPPSSFNRRLRLLLLSRTSLAIGVILFAGAVGGALWAWIFINERLAPLVEKNIQQILGRPVQVGEVQDISFNGLRFGSSSVPATATDPDNLRARAVEVQFDPWQLLLNRTLKLNVTLVQPNVYIAQDREGRWVTTEIKTPPEEGVGLIRTDLESIRVENADVLLFPYSEPKRPKAFVGLTQVNGVANFLDQNQRINFTLNGQPRRGGNLRIAGETNLKANQTNLKINSSNLLASDVTRLIELPLDLQGGRLDSNLTVQFQPTQPEIALFGTVGLNQVTAQIANVPRAFNNTTGKLEFQGQTVAVENLNTSYGSIPLQASGKLNTETGYNLTAQVKAASVKNLLDTLNVNLPVPTAGTVQANLQLQGQLQKPILAGTISTVQSAQIDRLTFSNISSRLRLTPSELVLSNIQATPTVGGKITGNGRVGLGTQNKIAFNLQAQNLPGDAIAKIYEAAPTFTIGNFSANAQVSGIPGNFQTAVKLQAPGATYSGQVGILIENTGVVRFQDGVFKVAGGTIQARGSLAQEKWQAFVDANNIQLSRLPQVPPQYQGVLNGEFALSGTTKSFQPSAIQASGQANVKLAQGNVNLNNIRLNNGRWQAVVNASQLPLSQIAQNLPPGQIVSSKLNLLGTTESFELSDIQAAGQANLRLADGTVNLRNIRLDDGRWQALANISQVQLNTLSPQLRGRLNGEVTASGTTESFQLSNIQAAGQVRFSQGLAQLQQPLSAQFQWNGEQLQILQATAPGLRAAGTVAVQVEETPQVTGFNLDVQAQNYNLQNLPLNLPGNVALAGLIDFTGQLTGTPATPIASGDIRLRNFAVNGVAFDPLLTGQVNFQPEQGTRLQLTGKQDQIALTLDPNNRPLSFLIQRDRAVATGRTEGENLFVNVRDFPVAVLENFVPRNATLRPVAGNISGDLVVNLTNNTFVGDVAIAQPRIGRISADEFRGRIGFADGTFTLQQGQIRQGEGLYSLSGELPTLGDRPLQFQLGFNQARIEQVLQAVSIFGFQDVATGLQAPDLAGAEALQTQPVSLPDAPLLAQLRFFAKIQEIVAQQRQEQQQEARIPTLAELTGTISGNVAVTGTLQQGLNIGFNLTGSDWEWGKYNINQVIAQGNFADGVLTLLPLRANLNGSLLAFSGQLSQEQLSGQARAEALPVELIEPFLPDLPVDITGTLNTLVTLGGNLENPRAIGEIGLVNGTVNKQSLDTAQVSFNYNDARLNFGSTVQIAGTGTQPVQITGSVPFELPFAAVEPDSNQISIQANVQDEGLAVVNAFTNQFSWVKGQGQVDVEIEGTLDQPVVSGITTIKNATLNVQNLPEPLTNVTGTIRFVGDRFIVEQLQGDYSRGQLTAKGILPIFATQNAQQQAATNPLTITSENLQLNLPELYQGGVSGNIVITGTARDPQIGGDVRLSNGEISLRERIAGLSAAPTTPGATPTQITTNTTPPPTPANETPATPPIQFADLRVFLEDDVRVTAEPLFNFVAEGDITLNGTLAEPRPQGTISLRRGQVNLFVTQFALARGYEQTATFTPKLGFDPILDVRLVTFVPEVRGSRLPATAGSSEIQDISAINFGTLNTVRVEARVQGPASDLADNLELTSQPARTEAEIIALIGGSFLNVLGQSDTGLGIATIAGSTFFPGLQGTVSQLGEAIGLRDLRIFPTVVTNPASNVSVLGLAAEAVVGITDDLSASISRVFAANESFRYGIIYRLNDQFILRGFTNLADESRAVIEYETRF
jgi:translocation and assembly module TamB